MARGNIKTGGGAAILSPVYQEMGPLGKRSKGIARPKPIRGEKQRKRGR